MENGRQAVRMLRDMGTDCTVKNCRLAFFILEEGHTVGERSTKS